MITPLLPIVLTATLGAGPAIVGFVEGLAEATASVLKLVSGRLADRGVPAKGLRTAPRDAFIAAASLAKMAIAMTAGVLADRVGRVPLLLGGWALFIAYSATLAITEPVERSLIGDHADERERGTAFATAAGATALAGAVLVGLAGGHGRAPGGEPCLAVRGRPRTLCPSTRAGPLAL